MRRPLAAALVVTVAAAAAAAAFAPAATLRPRCATRRAANATPNPNATAATPPSSSSAFEKRLASLRFGYERRSGGGGGVPRPLMRRRPAAPSRLPKASAAPKSPCTTLVGSGANASSVPLGALPCVASGECPYVKFRCPAGHVWNAVPGSAVCFQCPRCTATAGTEALKRNTPPRRTLAELRAVAAARGGRVLELEEGVWSGVASRVTCECAVGHTWVASADSLLNLKTWCPTCASGERGLRRRLTMADMHETAKARGGECLSEAYGGIGTKLRWRCAAGHEFDQTPNNVRRRARGGSRGASWCGVCAAAERRAVRLAKAQPQPQACEVGSGFGSE